MTTMGSCTILMDMMLAVSTFAISRLQVTGVFCNTAIESAHSDRDIRAIEQLNKQTALVRSLKDLFQDPTNLEPRKICSQLQ